MPDSAPDRSPADIRRILILVGVTLFLLWHAWCLLAEDDSIDDEPPPQRRRLHRALHSAPALPPPPALAFSQSLVWMAAGCAYDPSGGSGYWSLPRARDFSLLVHSARDDAKFYSYFRFNRCAPPAQFDPTRAFSPASLPFTTGSWAPLHHVSVLLVGELLLLMLLRCERSGHEGHRGQSTAHLRVSQSKDLLGSSGGSPGRERRCERLVQDCPIALAGRNRGGGRVLTISSHLRGLVDAC